MKYINLDKKILKCGKKTRRYLNSSTQETSFRDCTSVFFFFPDRVKTVIPSQNSPHRITMTQGFNSSQEEERARVLRSVLLPSARIFCHPTVQGRCVGSFDQVIETKRWGSLAENLLSAHSSYKGILSAMFVSTPEVTVNKDDS